jgi:hypothetical protein
MLLMEIASLTQLEAQTPLRSSAATVAVARDAAADWQGVGAAVLEALELQAEAFKRQMHGVK